MTYGQQPPPNGNVPPPPPVPGAPAQHGYGAPQPGYGAPTGQPTYGAPSNQYGYGGGMPGQPGYAGWAGASAVRPGSVTGGSVLAIIGGIVAILFGGLFFLVSGIANDPSVLAGTGFSAETFMGLGGIVGFIGILVLVFGIMALRGKYWAAIALTVMGGLYVALAIFSMIQGQGGVLVGIIYIAISVSLLMSGGSRAWFKAQQ